MTTLRRKRAKRQAQPTQHHHSNDDGKGKVTDFLAQVWLGLQRAPTCQHGPLLLFEESTSQQPRHSRLFFSCSVCRDGTCAYRLPIGTALQTPTDTQEQTRREYEERHAVMRLKKAKQRGFCKDCMQLYRACDGKDALQHKAHNVICNVSQRACQQPTRYLTTPTGHRRVEAQYFFTQQDIDTVKNIIAGEAQTTTGVEEMNVAETAQHVLCIGCPTIHESIHMALSHDNPASSTRKGEPKRCDSLLLDIDARFAQFFPDSFVHFNMLNNTTFGADHQERLSAYLQQCTAIIVDPPFGCPIGALHTTLSRLLSLTPAKHNTPTLLFFPYFSEKAISRHFSSSLHLRRTTYCASYTNHTSYTEAPQSLVHCTTKRGKRTKEKNKKKNGKREEKEDLRANGVKKLSPVRLYTNIPEEALKLPTEIYRWCDVCCAWSFRHTPHCDKCGVCPSINGQVYSHCDDCGTCVKPKRVHCDQCARCHLPNMHNSTAMEENTSDTRTEARPHSVGMCYLCGRRGHERLQCPKWPSHIAHITDMVHKARHTLHPS